MTFLQEKKEETASSSDIKDIAEMNEHNAQKKPLAAKNINYCRFLYSNLTNHRSNRWPFSFFLISD